MRKIIYSLGVILALSIASCTDFVDPAIPYSDFETGVYLRTLAAPITNISIFELNQGQFNLTVEAVDIQDGKLVQDVDVLVARRRGPNVTPEVKIGNMPASAFQSHTTILPDVHPASGSKYPAASFSISIPQVIQALGLTNADIDGADIFEFRLVLRTTDGRTFTNTNLSPDISGGQFYRSPFFYRVTVVCPSTLSGTYDLSTVGWCGTTFTGQVRLVADAAPNGSRYTVLVNLNGTDFVDDFSFGFYRACYGAATAPPGGAAGLRMTDACGKLGFNSASSTPWGDTFQMGTVTVNGPVLTIEVSTSFPPEAGTATLTRTDGTSWPALR